MAKSKSLNLEKIKTAREGALHALYAVEQEGAYANLILDRILREAFFSKQDRSFLTELVYGTLRWQGTLDWVLGQMLRTGLNKLHPWTRNILRLGTYQLLFLERVPASAVCDQSTNLAKRYGPPGFSGLVNGVLRNIARREKNWEYPDQEKHPVQHLAVKYSHPVWMVERWLPRYGFAQTQALCQQNNQPAPNTIRTNTLRTEPEKLKQDFQDIGVEAERSAIVAEGLKLKGISAYGDLELFQQGLFQIQDESSMLAGHGLNPFPGSLVLDLCAAPGGKTTHLAQLMQNRGQIYACDHHAHKISLIQQNCQRLGIQIVQAQKKDARKLPEEWQNKADFVLVDAPCSGLGVLRRRPDARWRKKPEEIKQLAQLQQQLLQAAAQCVRPGGVLLYSTCTLEPEENEQVVENFLGGLNHDQDFSRESLVPLLPSQEWSAQELEEMQQGSLSLFPPNHGTDGFYLARLRRKSS